MGVSYRKLLLELSRFAPDAQINNLNICLQNFRLYSPNTSYSYTDTLVICSSIENANQAFLKNAGNILCITDNQEGSFSVGGSVNTIRIVGNEYFNDVINSVIAAFYSRERVVEDFMSLMNVMTYDPSIERVLLEIRRILHNPIVVVSSNMELIAQTVYEDESRSKELTKAVTSLGNDSVFRSKLISNVKPAIIKWPEAVVNTLGYKAICGRLNMNGSPYGYVFILEYLSPLSTDDYDTVEMISNVISYTIRVGNSVGTTNASEIRRLQRAILTGNYIPDIDNINKQFRLLGWQIPDQMFVAAAKEIHTSGPSTANLSYITKEMEQIFFDSTAIVINDKIVFIISQADYDSNFDELCIYLEKQNIRMGLSRCFSDIKNTKGAYQEALDALRTGLHLNSKSFVYQYDSFNSYYPIYAYIQNHSADTLVNPAIQKLVEYDIQKGTELLKTISVYFDCLLDSNTAAERLHIHRNSLYKRLEKIREISGINTTIQNSSFGSLFYSIRTYEFINRHLISDE